MCDGDGHRSAVDIPVQVLELNVLHGDDEDDEVENFDDDGAVVVDDEDQPWRSQKCMKKNDCYVLVKIHWLRL